MADRDRLPFDRAAGIRRNLPRPQTRRNPVQRKPHGVVTREGTSLVIKFSGPWAPFTEAVKEMRGYRYDPERHRWSVHIGHIRQVRAAATLHGWHLSPQVAAIPDVDAEDLPMEVWAEGEQLVVDGPFRDDVWKALKEAGGRLQSATGRWFIPLERAVDAVFDMRAIARIRFLGERSEIMAQIERAAYMLDLSRQLEPSPDWTLAPTVKRTLRPFQHGGVEHAYLSRRWFDWATMGAGKTTVSLAALEHQAYHHPDDDPFPTLIVPPAGLKTNWVREVRACIPHRDVYVCEGKRPPSTFGRAHPAIWICNYDLLGLPTPREDRVAGRPGTWVDFIVELMGVDEIRSYVVDEGHRVNNPKAQRTIALIEASGALPRERTRHLLTGTPIRNGRRAELVPQLTVIGRDGEFGDAKQLKDDNRLARRLRSVCAWRPDPASVLRALGVLNADGTVEPVVQTVVVDGDPKVMADYRRAEESFLDYLRDKARAKARELGQDPESAAVAAAMKASSAEGLMLIGTLRRLAGQAKIGAAREWVTDFEATGAKLLVFAENHDMMDAVSAGRIPQIRGGMKSAARDLLVDRFQDEEWIDPADRLQTLVLQIVAAGEGLTLTKAYDILFTQLAWAPGAHDQAAARAAWRMNDPHNVITHYLLCAETLDEDVMAVQLHKREEMAQVTDGDVRTAMASESTYGAVFGRLLGRALGMNEGEPQ